MCLMATFAVLGNCKNYRLASYWIEEDDIINGLFVDEPTTLSYNEQGLLLKIDYYNLVVSLDYSTISEGYIILSKYLPTIDVLTEYNVYLDDNGMAAYAERVSGQYEPYSFTFTYTNDFLSHFEEETSANMYFSDLNYENGNLTSVERYAEDNPGERTEYCFGYSDYPNTGSLALIESLFGLELDSVEILAQAGFLGKPSSELPTSVNMDGEDVVTLWDYNDDGYPCRFYSPDIPNISVNFDWEEIPAGINVITDDNITAPKEIYRLDGTKVDSISGNGLFIVKNPDGTSSKILR